GLKRSQGGQNHPSVIALGSTAPGARATTLPSEREIGSGLFLLPPGAQRSPKTASRGQISYFAWGCFRYFGFGTCRAPPNRRYAGSGTHAQGDRSDTRRHRKPV